MLAIPMIFGIASGGAFSVAAWLIVPATVLVFLAHFAIVPWAQRVREGKPPPPGYAARRLSWGAVYLTGSALFFAGAVVAARGEARFGLLSIAAVAAVLAGSYAAAAVAGSGRALLAEILGMIGMSLTAPMMAAAAGRPMARALFGASAMALAYFMSSVAFVRSYDRMKTDPSRATAFNAFAHIGIAEGIALAAFARMLPPLWWLAFVPVVARSLWGLMSPPANLRALGMRELWVALSFTALGTFCFLV
jgi:hypothetical protein